LRLLSLAIPYCDRVVMFDNSRALMVMDGTQFAGRLVGEINNRDLTNPSLALSPPLPAWLFAHALLPFAAIWEHTEPYRDAMTLFGDQIAVRGSMTRNDPASRKAFLRQFRFD
jgi:hypothetical protein